jgi:hypothetical protein
MEQPRTSQSFLTEAIERQRKDSGGWSWVFFQEMTAADRKAFDRWLVENEDPLAYQPGTTEHRFRSKVHEGLKQNPKTTMNLQDAKRTFASLMQKARSGSLTERDRGQLTVARQMLRRAKRPAMNPKEKTIPQLWKRAQLLYNRYKTETREYQEIANKLGLPITELNRRISRARSERSVMNPRITLPDGREFPEFEGKPLSWDPGSHFTLEDERKGYPKTKAVLRELSDSELHRHQRENLRASFGNIFSGNAKRFLRLIEEEIERRGKKNPKVSRAKRNPRSSIVRLGHAEEVRYHRNIGRQPGYYKHAIRSRKAGIFTIPAGWVYVSGKSILITEGTPRV